MSEITTAAAGYDYVATLLSPLAHGAGNAGNTRLLRTQEVINPDTGDVARVPFLSAASIRHGLRSALAQHLASTLLEPGSLTKPAVDLLWSGGAVSSTGAQVDLELERRVDTLLPSLSLLGYAAQSDIHEGVLRVSDLILICDENKWRIPARAAQPVKRAAAYRGEEFGTRHDIANTPAAAFIQAADTLTGEIEPVKTTQMIFDTQVLLTGARMHGTIGLTPAATETHRMVLDAALALWAPNGDAWLGASTATGYGHVDIDWGDRDADTLRQNNALAAWTENLHDHADDIRQLIAEVAK